MVTRRRVPRPVLNGLVVVGALTAAVLIYVCAMVLAVVLAR